MQDDSPFELASNTDAKSRKSAKKTASSKKQSTSTLKKNKGAAAMFLSTQPPVAVSPAGEAPGDDMDFERLPLDYGLTPNVPTIKSSKKTSAAEATAAMAMDEDDDDDSILIDPSSFSLPTPVTRLPAAEVALMASSLSFPAVATHTTTSGLTQKRKISIPPHRMTPLKRDWIKIYGPLVEELGLQVRMNLGRRWVELKTSKHTPSASSLSRASDFLSAYALGFTSEDAIALLRLEELYVESFEIKDVKTLLGDHLSRAIGRIAGHEGKTRFVIENASRTRVVLADTKIHILGTYTNIKIARDAICALILGSPPGKIYAGLRQVASRSRERF